MPHHFCDIDLETGFCGAGLEVRAAAFRAMSFPVLLLQTEKDPNQPQYYFENATDAFLQATLRWVTDVGHFTGLSTARGGDPADPRLLTGTCGSVRDCNGASGFVGGPKGWVGRWQRSNLLVLV